MPSRTVLCPAILLTILIFSTTVRSAKLEPFRSLAHGVKSGPVELTDKEITIPDFHYDGKGPAAYFFVGKCSDKFRDERPKPPLQGTKLAHEGTGTLKEYTGQTIKLTLPAGKSWKDYDYISVYCVDYNHNFGYVEIKKEIVFPNECRSTGKDIPSYCQSCTASGRSTWEFRSFVSYIILLSAATLARWTLAA